MLTTTKKILSVANKYFFAVPAFNISDYAMLNGVLETSEKLRSPLIIAIHPDELRHIGTEMLAAIIEKSHTASVPVCIHLDHGANFEQVITAIKSGFTSVMIDGSGLPFKENISLCQKVTDAAHAVNVSVEGELGTIGAADTNGECGMEQIIYTNPDDAVEFVEKTKVDSLAIAIGTSHGLYPKGAQPKLELDLLMELKSRVNVPLVLHGGSGNPDSEISQAVERGINKINISSDIKAAYYSRMREVLKENLNAREPNVIEPPCIAAMQVVAEEKINLFKANGKADLY